MAVPESTGSEEVGFAGEATQRLRAAQAAVTELLGGVGLGGARPTEIGRELGLDKTLAWKVARFAEDEDPREAVRHLPGPGGLRIVLRAAAARGVTESRLQAVRDADGRLRRFLKQHAGDRRSFEAMLAGERLDDRADLEERRAFFRAGSAIWGVRARVQVLTLALRPSDTEPGTLDTVQVGGLVDFERLRADVPWIFRRLRVTNDAGTMRTVVHREPLDPDGAAEGGAPLFRAYCSEPPAPLRQFVGANGWVYDEISAGPVGRRGAVTCLTGEVYRAVVPSVRSEENTVGCYTLMVRTPVEAVLFDLLLHEDLTHFGPAEMRVMGLLEDRPRHAGGLMAMAPMRAPERARALGQPALVQTGRLPRYGEMVADALERAGWGTLASFRGYRAELEYPAAPCELALVSEIGEQR